MILAALLAILTACHPAPDPSATGVAPTWIPEQPVEPTPPASPTPGRPVEQEIPVDSTSDRLAEPPLPANPTQYQQGRHLFWLNCMPCHGDRGQGLTDEFRSLWVADHQNCWGRGCHAGREGDVGYPLPRSIPAVISSSGDLPPFATPQELFDYLRTTHPPQHPGYLSEEKYWAITAYLLIENNRLPPGQEVGP